MRVVEYKKDTTSPTCQILKGAGIVSAIFSIIVCALMIANGLSLKKTDPIHSPALQKLVEELKTNPNDQALREEIRELDSIARRAFFTSQHFNKMGIWLLVGGLVVMIIAFKSLEAYKTIPPFPDSSDPKDDIVENAKWARKAVTTVGLLLVGFALMIALPWESTLEIPDEVVNQAVAAAAAKGKAKPSASAAVSPSKAEVDPTPAPVAVADAKPIASPEEMLKNWPALLGPANSVTRSSGVLTEWNGESGDGIKWKTALPLPGYGSPVIWNGKIYLTGANESTREVYCVDSENGELLWQRAASNVPGSPGAAPEVSDDTGHAAGTMATDGARVFAMFGNGDLIALDLEGNPVWSKNIGIPENPYGYATSLLIYQDILIVQFDNEKDSYVGGFDVKTGQARWKTPRDFGPSWSTPTVVYRDEGDELVLAAEPTVVSYDPKNGKELWRVDCLGHGEVAARPVYANGIVYVSADAAILAAIDIESRDILWKNDDLKPGVSTPLALDGLLYCATDDGAMVCYDGKTGEEIWAEFADDGFYSSPLLIEDRIYMMDRGGIMHILKPGREYEEIGAPELGEESSCTPAVIGDSIYLRGIENLYRIGP